MFQTGELQKSSANSTVARRGKISESSTAGTSK
jgi:hypothetical protein